MRSVLHGDCADSNGADLTSCIADSIQSRLDAFEIKAESGPGPGSRMIPVFIAQEAAKGVELLLLATVLQQYSADDEETDVAVLEVCIIYLPLKA